MGFFAPQDPKKALFGLLGQSQPKIVPFGRPKRPLFDHFDPPRWPKRPKRGPKRPLLALYRAVLTTQGVVRDHPGGPKWPKTAILAPPAKNLKNGLPEGACPCFAILFWPPEVKNLSLIRSPPPGGVGGPAGRKPTCSWIASCGAKKPRSYALDLDLGLGEMG